MTRNRHRNLADYGFQLELLPRYADMNSGRHISNVAIQDLHTEARMQFQTKELGLAPWFPDLFQLRPASLTSDFLAVTNYSEPIQCGVTLVGKNASAYRFETVLFQDGACVGVQDCRMAAWQNGQRIGLPAQVRDCLASAESICFSEGQADSVDPDRFPYFADLSPRFGDLDADGCISESAIASYVDQARSQLMSGLFASIGIEYAGQVLGLLGARIAIEFRSYRPLDGKLRLGIGALALGNSSFTLRVGIFSDACCVALADTVMVCINPAEGRPVPIPDNLRHALEQWRCDVREAAYPGEEAS